MRSDDGANRNWKPRGVHALLAAGLVAVCVGCGSDSSSSVDATAGSTTVTEVEADETAPVQALFERLRDIHGHANSVGVGFEFVSMSGIPTTQDAETVGLWVGVGEGAHPSLAEFDEHLEFIVHLAGDGDFPDWRGCSSWVSVHETSDKGQFILGNERPIDVFAPSEFQECPPVYESVARAFIGTGYVLSFRVDIGDDNTVTVTFDDGAEAVLAPVTDG